MLSLKLARPEPIDDRALRSEVLDLTGEIRIGIANFRNIFEAIDSIGNYRIAWCLTSVFLRILLDKSEGIAVDICVHVVCINVITRKGAYVVFFDYLV